MNIVATIFQLKRNDAKDWVKFSKRLVKAHELVNVKQFARTKLTKLTLTSYTEICANKSQNFYAKLVA